jgi:nitric oxide reductase NorE protein
MVQPATREAGTTPTPSPEGTRERRLPGNAGIWVFVLGDLFIFLGYFIIFMVYRYEHGALFLSSQRHLDLVSGLVNTLLLITSSRFVALAVVAARAGQLSRATRLIGCGAACGALFILVKVYEWVSLVNGGYTFPRNEFFMFYFSLTGVHLFHVALGLVVLGMMVLELRTPKLRSVSLVEAGAIYWHMVDLLWIILFALLYLMR